MGFKRTPEGRVFFQGADGANDGASNSANDEASPKLGKRPSNPSPQMRSPMTGDKTQGQIVTLLKTLNERLKTTQADRDQMMHELEKHRTIIQDLEGKADRSEKIARNLETQLEKRVKTTPTNSAETLKALEETRRALSQIESSQSAQNKALTDKITKSTSGVNAIKKRLEVTEAKQNVIDERVEAALNQQAKLVRKVDKAIEDRARFMRKIERIEETVIQTRDALNAKAMVVLTDQGAKGAGVVNEEVNEGIAKYLPDDLEDQISEAAQGAQRVADIKAPQAAAAADTSIYAKQNPNDQWWKNPSLYGAVTGVLAFILAILVISGLALNDWKIGGSQNADEDVTPISVQSYGQSATDNRLAEANARGPVRTPVREQAQPIENLDWQIEQQAPIANAPANEAEPAPAIDVNNAEQMAQTMETNPQAVAEALNDIEPQAQTPADADIAKLEPLEELPQAAVQQAPAMNASQPNEGQAQTIKSQVKPDKDLSNVIKKVEEQAFQGIGEAQHDLAAIYTAGHGGVKQDYSRAAYWFEKAAENGVANASYNLGVLHHQGLGFEPDITKAMTWYKDAAAKGHPEAQYNLGIAYIEGIGVPYDPVQASRYFEQAANSGVMEAAYNLGLIHENGLLGDAKPDNALIWYKNAADQGSPEAKQALDDLAANLGMSADQVNKVVDRVRTENGITQTLQTPSQPIPAASTDKESNVFSNQGTIAQIQEYLMRVGLYPGPADGVSGALTEDAIRSYQALNNIETNGAPTQNLLSHMLANSNNVAFGSGQ